MVLVLFGCGGVVEIVDVVACGAGDNHCVHGMVAMVDAFLAEAKGYGKRHIGAEEPFAVHVDPLAKVAGASDCVEPFEAWSHNVIPHIVQAPLFLQAIGDAATRHNDIL